MTLLWYKSDYNNRKYDFIEYHKFVGRDMEYATIDLMRHGGYWNGIYTIFNDII